MSNKNLSLMYLVLAIVVLIIILASHFGSTPSFVRLDTAFWGCLILSYVAERKS